MLSRKKTSLSRALLQPTWEYNEEFKRDCFAIFELMEHGAKSEWNSVGGCRVSIGPTCIILRQSGSTTYHMAQSPLFENAAVDFFGDEFAVAVETYYSYEYDHWWTSIILKARSIST